MRHAHPHRHASGLAHAHPHEHGSDTRHRITDETESEPPLHDHEHKTSTRDALLLILAVMATVFGVGTIATYVLLCVLSTSRMQQMRFGALERYGEIASGAFIALVGLIFLIWPLF